MGLDPNWDCTNAVPKITSSRTNRAWRWYRRLSRQSVANLASRLPSRQSPSSPSLSPQLSSSPLSPNHHESSGQPCQSSPCWPPVPNCCHSLACSALVSILSFSLKLLVSMLFHPWFNYEYFQHSFELFSVSISSIFCIDISFYNLQPSYWHVQYIYSHKKTERVTFDIFWPCGLPMHRCDLSPISKLQKCNQRRQETTVDQKPEGSRVQLCQAPWCPGRESSQFSWTSVPTPALPSDGKQTLETVALWPLPASNFHNCKMQKRCWQRHRANQRWSQFQTVLENHHPHLFTLPQSHFIASNNLSLSAWHTFHLMYIWKSSLDPFYPLWPPGARAQECGKRRKDRKGFILTVFLQFPPKTFAKIL